MQAQNLSLLHQRPRVPWGTRLELYVQNIWPVGNPQGTYEDGASAHRPASRQVIESPRNKVSAAYNYAQYLDGRKRMMQDRADYLDE